MPGSRIGLSVVTSKCWLPGQVLPYRVLTMRLSDAGLRRRQTKPIYPNHRLPLWFTEDATRDRSNRLLEGSTEAELRSPLRQDLQRRIEPYRQPSRRRWAEGRTPSVLQRQCKAPAQRQ